MGHITAPEYPFRKNQKPEYLFWLWLKEMTNPTQLGFDKKSLSRYYSYYLY